MLILILLLLFFIYRCSSFTFSFGHHPSPFRGLSPGFETHFVLSAQPIAEWFATLSFFDHSIIFLPRALQFWVGIFYPLAFFILCSFLTFLAQPAFIKASLGAGSYSLKVSGLHTDPQNTDLAHLFVWFTVIHNILYILRLYSYMSILQKFYLC